MFGKPFPRTPPSFSENPIPFSIEIRADDNSEGNSSRRQQIEPDELEIEDSQENADALDDEEEDPETDDSDLEGDADPQRRRPQRKKN